MASLQDYVAGQFPQHRIDVWAPTGQVDLELTANTVVSVVVGTRAGIDLLSVYRQSAPNATVAALEVKPSDPTVVPTENEDNDGVVDLPARRIAVYVAIGMAALGIIGVVLSLLLSSSVGAIVIAGVFGALIGALMGAIIGGARFAGERSTSQPRAPGQTVTVVAAFLDDPTSAASLAQSVGPAADYDVRIVDNAGGWHSPSTGRPER